MRPLKGISIARHFHPLQPAVRTLSFRAMKFISLIYLVALVLFEAGCATGPTIDEQAQDETQRAQVEKRSDAFAKQLQQ